MDVHSRLREFLNDRGMVRIPFIKRMWAVRVHACQYISEELYPFHTHVGGNLSQLWDHSITFFAENEMVELSPELKELFDNWVTLTTDQKQLVLQVIKALQIPLDQ